MVENGGLASTLQPHHPDHQELGVVSHDGPQAAGAELVLLVDKASTLVTERHLGGALPLLLLVGDSGGGGGRAVRRPGVRRVLPSQQDLGWGGW